MRHLASLFRQSLDSPLAEVALASGSGAAVVVTSGVRMNEGQYRERGESSFPGDLLSPSRSPLAGPAGHRLALALAVAFMGVVDIASAWFSHPTERLSALVRLVPTSVLDTSRTFTLLAGALLLITAWGLARGKRRSFVLALFLCALSVPVNMLKAFDFEEATVAVGLMFALGVSADAFRVGSRAVTWAGFRSGALWAISALIAYALVGSWVLGLVIDHDVSPMRAFHEAAWSVLGIGSSITIVPPNLPAAERRIAEWYLRSLPLLSVTLLVGLMVAALRPAAHRRRQGLQMERVSGILRMHGDSTVSSYALSPGTDWFFSRTGRSFIAYRHVSDVLLGIGDPVGSAEELPSLLEDFAGYAEARDWTPAFFQTSTERLALYRRLCWRALHIGEDPVISPERFTLEGGTMGDVRRAVSKAARAGLEVRLFHPHERRFEPEGADHGLYEQMREISAQWLSQHPGGEMDFCMGRFSAERLQSAWLAVGVSTTDARVEGFLTWEPVWARRGWTLDLMRRRPDSMPGTMESLIVTSIEAARTRGDAVLSLALSALANVPHEGQAPEEPESDRAREFLRRHLSGFYDFEGLFRWKRKFDPEFEDRFLVYPSALALPAVLLALVRAQSSGGLSALLHSAVTMGRDWIQLAANQRRAR